MTSREADGARRKKGNQKQAGNKPNRHPSKQNKDFRDTTTTTTTTFAGDMPVVSTRVCIKNLPPSFSSLKLRDYLRNEFRERRRHEKNTQDLVITDCFVLMDPKKKVSRRIAFAGFQTTEMAQQVIQLFDQTFALTSRLSVEPAKVDNNKKKDNKETNKSTSKSEAKKETKQNQQGDEIKSKEKSELEAGGRAAKALLLAGVGAKNKAKFWSNDLDLSVNNKPANADNDADKNTQTEKSKEGMAEDHDSDSSSASSSNNDDDNSVASDSSDDSADPLRNAIEKPAVMSDLDFLKSKQTKVDELDLEEEVEDQLQKDTSFNDDQKQKEEAIMDSGDSSSSSDSDSDSDSDDDAAKKDETSAAVVQLETTETKNDDDDIEGEQIEPDSSAKTAMTDNDNHDDDNSQDDSEAHLASNRLFVRNLPFSTTEEQLEEHFSAFGDVQECHIPVDDRKISKGFAFVTFEKSQEATVAMQELDGKDFQGRFIHVLPSRQKPKTDADEGGDQNNDLPLSYKERQELARRQEATKTTKGWSASFVRGDAVVDSLADRLGIRKGEILNVKDGLNSGDAAVRLALGETQVIEENREYFKNHGIDMEALVSMNPGGDGQATTKRSNTSILVKNLPYDTQVEELTHLFSSFGEAPKRVLLPPSRTIALVEYGHSSDAKKAFRKLAYRRFKSVPIYLEWAPIDAAVDSDGPDEQSPSAPPTSSNEVMEEEADEEPTLDGPTPSIYIKNLSFSTSEEKLQQAFDKAVGDVRAVRIPTKMAPVKKARNGTAASNNQTEEIKTLSMGFGFVEFGSQESARKALSKMQGTFLDGHALELKPSTKSLTQRAAKLPTSSKKNPTKVAVRNVPFQATRTELLKLFGSYGQLKRVRLPKKFDGGHRGFAFVEFVTHKEALAAMKSLSRTHLYGRHLVLEWAEDETEDPDTGLNVLRDRAQRDVDRQELGSGTQKHSKKRQKIS